MSPDPLGECASCGEGCPRGECPRSPRDCGHHCNHVWTHDSCDWCDWRPAPPPHRWDGQQWTCLECGEVHPDPCACPCHGVTPEFRAEVEQFITDNDEVLRRLADS